MVRRTLAERFADLDTPDERTDEEEIWGVVRAVLNIARVVVFLSIILVSEMLEEYFFNGLSVAIWSLIIGIPLFFAISVSILLGDSWFPKTEDEDTAVLRPIRRRD
ncbi:MAG TPA: hypothetical protein HA356_08480 [Candidatus Poseidoniaceae archaeon]|nr:MAG TPA: hypothetical protein D7H95_08455 [Candidatus Poseidoniales archaeon]HII12094.1 hypothetical protein [Candidatus Poseidoniaceae archaeon]|tara:strand:- start:4602 stop:4919 length:318 start_codon:yes stop_codon:yes gene_type:complete